MNIQLDLILTFARIGVCTFGGGYAMIPIIQREAVEKKGWITDEELADYCAISQCTPGVIAVNTATFVGRKLGGKLGGVMATLGVVAPSVAIIALVAGILQNVADLPAVIHAFNGIRACVCTLILSSILKLGKSNLRDWPSRILAAAVLILAAVGGFVTLPDNGWGVLLSYLTSPVTLVILSGLAGLFTAGKEAAP